MIKAIAKKSLKNVTSGKEYEVVKTTEKSVYIIDDSGVQSRRDIKSFTLLEGVSYTCITGKFKNLTKDKEYNVSETIGNFFMIKNDKGVIQKYGKNNFKIVANKVVPIPEKPKKKEEVKPKVIKQVECIYNMINGVDYGKIYDVIEESDRHYTIIFNNKPTPVIKLRFKDVPVKDAK